MNKKNQNKIFKLTFSAAVIAIIAIMSFTPLGYLKIGFIEISFLAVPVAIGAAILGKSYGALFGLAFGVTSFIQCFGASAFGVALLEINPIFTFISCIVPRVLVGFLSGMIYEALEKRNAQSNICAVVSFAAASVINTVGFVGCLAAFFYKTDYIQAIAEQLGAQQYIYFCRFVCRNKQYC